jgi:hypothetical protein
LKDALLPIAGFSGLRLAAPMSLDPTGKVPRFVPSLARSFVTVLQNSFVTQMLAPSKATPPDPGGPLHGVVAGLCLVLALSSRLRLSSGRSSDGRGRATWVCVLLCPE